MSDDTLIRIFIGTKEKTTKSKFNKNENLVPLWTKSLIYSQKDKEVVTMSQRPKFLLSLN
jgi:hypothetical protein